MTVLPPQGVGYNDVLVPKMFEIEAAISTSATHKIAVVSIMTRSSINR
jgi:hypothetical protein